MNNGTDTDLERVYVMVEPPEDWLTRPLKVAADGNAVMLKAVQEQKTQPHGAGKTVISELAALYRNLGRQVALFESSKAAQRVTGRLMGHADPDDVFTVDYCTGHRLASHEHLQSMEGELVRPDGGNYVNLVNRLSVPTRWLEPFVMQIIFNRLKVKNVLTQPEDTLLEGGDLAFLSAGDAPRTILLTGDGQNSRSNAKGRNWLYNLLRPTYRVDVVSKEFHRDLVSVFVQGTRGELVQALLAFDCIQNAEEVAHILRTLNVDIVDVPADAVKRCAVNLSVSPGLVIGMQSHEELHRILTSGLPKGVTYYALPDHLQSLTAGFIDMQGGANCVSGNILARPGELDLSAENIAGMNAYLHGRDCEAYLDDVAKKLHLKEALEQAAARQRASIIL